MQNQLLESPAKGKERSCRSGKGYDTSLIAGQKMWSPKGAESWGVLHRERGLTPQTLKISCSHTPILQHAEQHLFKTIRTDIVLWEANRRIDRRTTVKLGEFILTS